MMSEVCTRCKKETSPQDILFGGACRDCVKKQQEGGSVIPVLSSSPVNHPSHYGGEHCPYEAIKIIEAHNLDFSTGNVIKYVLRAGKKEDAVQDLQKALWYLERKINHLKSQS